MSCPRRLDPNRAPPDRFGSAPLRPDSSISPRRLAGAELCSWESYASASVTLWNPVSDPGGGWRLTKAAHASSRLRSSSPARTARRVFSPYAQGSRRLSPGWRIPRPPGTGEQDFFNAQYGALARNPYLYGYYQFRFILDSIDRRAELDFGSLLFEAVAKQPQSGP
jgi:hypothetical protein